MSQIVKRRPSAFTPCALALGLALLASGCAGDSSGTASSDDLFDEFDNNNDNRLDQDEFGGKFSAMDTDGDGVVSRGEFNASIGGGRR